MVNDALASLDAEFEALYTDFGRPGLLPGITFGLLIPDAQAVRRTAKLRRDLLVGCVPRIKTVPRTV